MCQEPVSELVFSSAVSTFKFGSTFKSTQKARFPRTLLELSALEYTGRPVVLDVGASDGITSLDVMQTIPYSKYYVTDLNIEVSYQVLDGATWFYDENGICILRVTDRWVMYPDIGTAIFPFNKIAQAFFSLAPKPDPEALRIFLINPLLKMQTNPAIVIQKHNILDAWPQENVDLIIAANILNRGYFTASEIEQALRKLFAALNDGGIIAIIDNRPAEKATLFQLNDGAANIIKRINGGTEIENLAVNIFSKISPPSAVNKAVDRYNS